MMSLQRSYISAAGLSLVWVSFKTYTPRATSDTSNFLRYHGVKTSFTDENVAPALGPPEIT